MKILFCFIVCLLAFDLTGNAQKPNDSQYIAKTKQLLSRLEQGKYDDAATFFDASVSDKISAKVLEKAWKKITGQVGDVNSTGIPKTEQIDSLKIVIIPCLFEKLTLDLKVTWLENQKAIGVFFVPHKDDALYKFPGYADPTKVAEKAIIIKTGNFKLPGYLTYPRNATGKFPVVILVHGSGPNDMDESVGPNKPFKDLAYGLASKGIGVIRYDKRTKVYASQMAEKTNRTLEDETIQDAMSAIRLAKTLPGADTNRIFVLGHSLGAMSAPRIADYAGKSIAGIIMMAGNARPLVDLIWEQMNYLATLNDAPKNQKQLTDMKTKIDKVKNGELSPKTSSEQLPLGIPAGYWLYLNAYHQTEIAAKLTIPVLVLQGERDYQVRMTDFELWKKAFTGDKKADFKSYPKLNHLFMEGEGAMSTPSEYNIPGHIADYVVDDIAVWILKQH
jgi:uncharacterized protein